MSRNVDYRIRPGGSVQGRCRVPGDKSISHRAVLLGALAEQDTIITGFLEGEDTLATLAAFESLGVMVERSGSAIRIHGSGGGGLRAPQKMLDMGNSGTGMRLLTGVLAGQDFDSTLTGDKSLSMRPMGRIIRPLELMGARIEAIGGTAPLTISGHQALRGLTYSMPVASAQVKSSVLLAGLHATGRTTVIEPAPTRDHTERMLRGFGYAVDIEGSQISLMGGGRLTGRELTVPGDLSSASFVLVAAILASEHGVTLESVGVNPTRDGVLRILCEMGARVRVTNRREVSGEPVADLEVSKSDLHGIDVPPEWVPLAIDEFPAVLIAAACAEGATTVRGAEELRVKETDRIDAMARGLSVLGVRNEVRPDGIVVHGGSIGGGQVDSCGDHRIAMAFAVAGLNSDAGVLIKDCANVATSFPGFVELMRELGLPITAESVA